MATPVRMIRLFLILLFIGLIPKAAHSQHTANNTQQAISSVNKDSCMYWGIFDSTDSYFVVKTDSIFSSPFDTNCFRAHAKTWHRNQLADCKLYLTAVDFYKVNDTISVDSTEEEMQQFETLLKLQQSGSELYFLTGAFFMTEEGNTEYAGIFDGLFHMYFLRDTKTKAFRPAGNECYHKAEPWMLFQGYWKAYTHTELGSIPFFWASVKPEPDEEETTLPDMRIQPDGSQHYDFRVNFSASCAKPGAKWYK